MRDAWRAIQTSKQESVCLAWLAGYGGLCLLDLWIADPHQGVFQLSWNQGVVLWAVFVAISFSILYSGCYQSGQPRFCRLLYLFLTANLLLSGTLFLIPILGGVAVLFSLGLHQTYK